MTTPRPVFAVVISANDRGYPEGTWMRVCYQAMAETIRDRLRAEGVPCAVREEGTW